MNRAADHPGATDAPVSAVSRVEEQTNVSGDTISPKELRVAITGHRPGGLWDASGRPVDLAAAISEFLLWINEKASLRGYDTVTIITGGALGVDQEVAAATERLRDAPDGRGAVKNLRSCIVLPFPPEILGARWQPRDVARLIDLVAHADEVVGPLYEHYSVGGLHARNHKMVDSANIVVGFWNGTHSGGTYACLCYALAKGKPMLNALSGMRRINKEDLLAA